MHFSTLVSSLALAGAACAQYNYGSGSGAAASSASTSAALTVSSSAASAAPAPSGSVTVHVVKVSNKDAKLVFDPADIKAAVGDFVQYHFYPKNHSVVQSSFDQPCVPLANSQPGSQGFFSGFMPVSNGSSTMPTYTIPVKDTKPIWFYCSQGKHCQGGMVGVINAPANNSSRTLDAYKAAAASAPDNVSPSCNATAPSAAPAPSTLATSASAPPVASTSSAPAQATTNAGSSVVANTRASLLSAGLVAAAMALLL